MTAVSEMPRRPATGFTLELPEIESFTEDEQLLARVSVGIVRGGGAMYHGRLFECAVARLLDAKFPLLGTSPWDLILNDGTRVEVRSGATKFGRLMGVKDVHAWVFVHKLEGDTPYSAASAADVAAIGQTSVACATIAARFGLVAGEELPAAVRSIRSKKAAPRLRR